MHYMRLRLEGLSCSWAFALFNPPLISSALQLFTVWVFIFTVSNENSTLFKASPNTHMLTYPHLCRVWSMPWRLAILFARIEEQPQVRQWLFHKTSELEWKCWLLFVGRSNLQRGTCWWSQPRQRICLMLALRFHASQSILSDTWEPKFSYTGSEPYTPYGNLSWWCNYIIAREWVVSDLIIFTAKSKSVEHVIV